MLNKTNSVTSRLRSFLYVHNLIDFDLEHGVQVQELLHGDFSCLKFMKKNRIPFLRKVFREELINAEG